MKILFIASLALVSMMLTACQVNSVRDTGGGAVSPSSTVTGVELNSGMPNIP